MEGLKECKFSYEQLYGMPRIGHARPFKFASPPPYKKRQWKEMRRQEELQQQLNAQQLPSEDTHFVGVGREVGQEREELGESIKNAQQVEQKEEEEGEEEESKEEKLLGNGCEMDEEDLREEETLKLLKMKEKSLQLEVKDIHKKIDMLSVVLNSRVEPEGKYKVEVRKTEDYNEEAHIGSMNYKKHQHYTRETYFMKKSSPDEIKRDFTVDIKQKRENLVEYFIKKFEKLTMLSDKKAKTLSGKIENFIFANCNFIRAKKYMDMAKNVVENIKLVKLFEVAEEYLHKSSFPIEAFTKDKGYFKEKCSEFEREISEKLRQISLKKAKEARKLEEAKKTAPAVYFNKMMERAKHEEPQPDTLRERLAKLVHE